MYELILEYITEWSLKKSRQIFIRNIAEPWNNEMDERKAFSTFA